MMSRVADNASNGVNSDIGIGGNLYIYSADKQHLVEVCKRIDKSPSSIYFNKKHQCWTIRIKSKKHKEAWLRG